MSLRKLLLVTIVAALALPGLADARGRRRLKPREEFKPPYDLISAVDASAQTFTITHVNSTNTAAKTYKVNNVTEYQINGQKGRFSDVQPGLKVNVSPSMNPDTAERVVMSPAPAEPKKQTRKGG